MKAKLLKVFFLILMSVYLVGCGSQEEESDDTGSGGYIGCVFELTEARNAGIISATNEEIQEECRSQLLP